MLATFTFGSLNVKIAGPLVLFFRDIENGGSVDLSIGCLGSVKHEEQEDLYMLINSDEDIDLIFFGLDDAPDCGVPSA